MTVVLDYAMEVLKSEFRKITPTNRDELIKRLDRLALSVYKKYNINA